jgi:hypothetical protein
MAKTHYPPGLHHALSGLRKGRLHRALGVPEDQPIPKEKLEAAKNSKDESIRHMANFASTLEGFHHGGDKGKK